MTEPTSPYKIKPQGKPIFEEQKLIQIKDDTVRPPSSIGTDSFQATIFGAPSLQPSKAEENHGVSIGGLILLLIIIIPIIMAIKATFF